MTQQLIPRKYFSGGFEYDIDKVYEGITEESLGLLSPEAREQFLLQYQAGLEGYGSMLNIGAALYENSSQDVMDELQMDFAVLGDAAEQGNEEALMKNLRIYLSERLVSDSFYDFEQWLLEKYDLRLSEATTAPEQKIALQKAEVIRPISGGKDMDPGDIEALLKTKNFRVYRLVDSDTLVRQGTKAQRDYLKKIAFVSFGNMLLRKENAAFQNSVREGNIQSLDQHLSARGLFLDGPFRQDDLVGEVAMDTQFIDLHTGEVLDPEAQNNWPDSTVFYIVTPRSEQLDSASEILVGYVVADIPAIVSVQQTQALRDYGGTLRDFLDGQFDGMEDILDNIATGKSLPADLRSKVTETIARLKADAQNSNWNLLTRLLFNGQCVFSFKHPYRRRIVCLTFNDSGKRNNHLVVCFINVLKFNINTTTHTGRYLRLVRVIGVILMV